jgi:hypothetical protein
MDSDKSENNDLIDNRLRRVVNDVGSLPHSSQHGLSWLLSAFTMLTHVVAMADSKRLENRGEVKMMSLGRTRRAELYDMVIGFGSSGRLL